MKLFAKANKKSCSTCVAIEENVPPFAQVLPGNGQFRFGETSLVHVIQSVNLRYLGKSEEVSQGAPTVNQKFDSKKMRVNYNRFTMAILVDNKFTAILNQGSQSPHSALGMPPNFALHNQSVVGRDVRTSLLAILCFLSIAVNEIHQQLCIMGVSLSRLRLWLQEPSWSGIYKRLWN